MSNRTGVHAMKILEKPMVRETLKKPRQSQGINSVVSEVLEKSGNIMIA